MAEPRANSRRIAFLMARRPLSSDRLGRVATRRARGAQREALEQQEQLRVAAAVERGEQAGTPLDPSPFEMAAKRVEVPARIAGEPLAMPGEVGELDVEIAHRAELLPEPAELARQPGMGARRQGGGEDAHRGAQPAHGDAHVVQGFGVAADARAGIAGAQPRQLLPDDGACRQADGVAGMHPQRRIEVGAAAPYTAARPRTNFVARDGMQAEPFCSRRAEGAGRAAAAAQLDLDLAIRRRRRPHRRRRAAPRFERHLGQRRGAPTVAGSTSTAGAARR